MKKAVRVLLASTVYMLTSALFAQTPPIAHYSFDAGPEDVTGNGYDGLFLGDAIADGGYLVLDGDDDAVDIPRIGGEGATFTQATYAMWIYPTADPLPLQFSGGINTNGWTTGAVHLKLNFGLLNVGINGFGDDVVGITVVLPEEWSHIALTVSETEVVLYLNGNLEGSRPVTTPQNLILGGGLIGAWNPGTTVDREMAGMMEEVIIYDAALTPEEIVALAAALPVGVASERDSDNIPEAFSLSQNYPNPFNPATTISFNLPKKSKVNIAVFDLAGHQVAELLDEAKPEGQYSVQFDGRNLSSGIYVCRMAVDGNYVLARKMALMK